MYPHYCFYELNTSIPLNGLQMYTKLLEIQMVVSEYFFDFPRSLKIESSGEKSMVMLMGCTYVKKNLNRSVLCN